MYFVRHAEPDYEHDCPFPGPPLTVKGRQQAQTVYKELSDTKFDRVYCSDYLRTQQTAELFAQTYDINYDSRLREIADCINGHADKNYLEEDVTAQIDRLEQFLNDLKNSSASSILIITHFNVIEHLSKKLGSHIKAPAYASIHVLNTE